MLKGLIICVCCLCMRVSCYTRIGVDFVDLIRERVYTYEKRFEMNVCFWRNLIVLR